MEGKLCSSTEIDTTTLFIWTAITISSCNNLIYQVHQWKRIKDPYLKMFFSFLTTNSYMKTFSHNKQIKINFTVLVNYWIIIHFLQLFLFFLKMYVWIFIKKLCIKKSFITSQFKNLILTLNGNKTNARTKRK